MLNLHPAKHSPTMPNNRKTTMKKIKGKEGVHPGSRKGESEQKERRQQV